MPAFHRLGGETGRVDPARGHLSGAPALGSGRFHREFGQRGGQTGERCVGHVGELARDRDDVHRGERVHEALDTIERERINFLLIVGDAFATLTLLTKNSFLDEVRKQYVITARAKGLKESRVLYGHVFRNAMLIVIAGFPGVFIGVFFSGSLIIETIFSLDGLGRLGFEAAVARDYPVIFGTLFFFGLIGLVVGILSDLMYVLVDPRIDFESRET